MRCFVVSVLFSIEGEGIDAAGAKRRVREALTRVDGGERTELEEVARKAVLRRLGKAVEGRIGIVTTLDEFESSPPPPPEPAASAPPRKKKG